MKIGLVLDPYGEEHPGGLGRAILEMARGIVSSCQDDEFIIYIKNPPTKPFPFEGRNWRLAPLGIARMWLASGKKFSRYIDLYIFFTPVIPIFFTPKRSIVVVHDFAYLEQPEGSFKERIVTRVLYLLHHRSLKKASGIVAVSQNAKEATVRYFGIPSEKITVIYNGFISLGAEPKQIEVPEKFFLFAGVLKARKNVLGVIEAFSEFSKTHSGYKLLIVGKKSGSYFNKVETLVRELNLEDKVIFSGYVSDGQLAYLYEKATALVFPSFIEGFGMPILEAMSRGLPVITSNIGALAEVAGDAAALVDPYNPIAIGAAMSGFADNEVLRQEYIQRGLRRAGEFSWEKNAREFQSLI
jgi:glycosyltransferase involved in cell wall biosynthesis